MRKVALMSPVVVVCLVLASCGGSSGPCDGVTGTCVAFAVGTSETAIQTQFNSNTLADGTTFAFAAGTFTFTNSLTVTKKNITIKGAGIDQTILDFKGMPSGTSGIGIDASGGHTDNFKVANLTVRDTPKNGVKVANATGVTFSYVKVLWTDTNLSKHGDYALYPVFCSNVLVEYCDISGSSDAGIYVGQSQHIIVRNNKAYANVAGIEIENSYFADVHDNTANNNTGGILVFDLPGSGNQHGGHAVHVFNNTISSNNGVNFNATGSTVGQVPPGTGTFVLATTNVEVDHNTFTGNKTTAFSVVSYYITQQPFTDSLYVPISNSVYVHDNTFTSNGSAPDTAATDKLGQLLAFGLSGYPGNKVPELIVDGISLPAGAVPNAPTGNPNYFCFANNTSTTSAGLAFMNLHVDQVLANPSSPDLSKETVSTSVDSAFNCTLPPLAAVSF